MQPAQPPVKLLPSENRARTKQTKQPHGAYVLGGAKAGDSGSTPPLHIFLLSSGRDSGGTGSTPVAGTKSRRKNNEDPGFPAQSSSPAVHSWHASPRAPATVAALHIPNAKHCVSRRWRGDSLPPPAARKRPPERPNHLPPDARGRAGGQKLIHALVQQRSVSEPREIEQKQDPENKHEEPYPENTHLDHAGARRLPP